MASYWPTKRGWEAMTTPWFDDDETEETKPEAELSEEEAREKRYQEEAAQKLTRDGGLADPQLDRPRRNLIVGVFLGAVFLLAGGAVLARNLATASTVSERDQLQQRVAKPGRVPDGWDTKVPAAAPPQDAYDAVDPKDPVFTTAVEAHRPAVECPNWYSAERCENYKRRMQGGGSEPGDDGSDCPAEYSPAECVKFEEMKMRGEGDPQGRGAKYMGSNYAANTSKGSKSAPGSDWEDEGLAPMTYEFSGKSQHPTLTASAPLGDAPMTVPAQPSLQLPPNLKQALEQAAQQHGDRDGDDVTEAFAARPGVLDSEDDERELAECELTAGTAIHVANLSAINTDVPAKSTVTAQVTQTVYCGADSQHVAIPAGSTFTASANARVSYGDERIQLCMEQLKRPPSRSKPNGSVTPVKCWAAADITGMVGWTGEVDNHWGQLVAGVALSTFLSLGTTSVAGNQEGFAPTIAQRAASNAGQQFNAAGQRIVQRDLQRKPTITRKMLQSGTVIVTENKPITPWVARKAKRRVW